MTTRTRRLAARALGSLQTRIVVAILLAVLPMAAISSVMAWQNYEAAAALGERRVATMLASSVTQLDVSVADAEKGALAVTHVADADVPAGCAEALRRFADFSTARVLAARVERGDGTEVCGSGRDGMAAAPIRTHDGRSTEVAQVRRGPRGEVLLPVVVHGVAPGGAALTITADLLVPTDFGTGAAWLLAPAGVDLARISGDLPPPRAATLRQLLGGASFVTERGTGRLMRGFVLGRLPNGTPLVIGDVSTREEARASTLLFWRFTAIALLLAAGVLAVALGAHLTVSQPIRTLTRRVTRWQAGETFDERPMRLQPTELADLFRAFGLATNGIVERETALVRARGEQDLLFKEIHHRVKNNLQIIASLLNLQASRIRVPEAKAEFQSARDRVRALATLHRHLYAEGGLHSIAMRPFLLELCDQLFQAIGEREGHRIRLEVEAPALQMSSDQAVPLALVVTETVSNAVKYAFPGGRSGHVNVRLTELADDMLELVVQDDGVGIPAGRAETETGIRDGLGIQLIRGFARQLAAELVVTEGVGTRYQLRLKLHRLHEDYPATAA